MEQNTKTKPTTSSKEESRKKKRAETNQSTESAGSNEQSQSQAPFPQTAQTILFPNYPPEFSSTTDSSMLSSQFSQAPYSSSYATSLQSQPQSILYSVPKPSISVNLSPAIRAAIPQLLPPFTDARGQLYSASSAPEQNPMISAFTSPMASAQPQLWPQYQTRQQQHSEYMGTPPMFTSATTSSTSSPGVESKAAYSFLNVTTSSYSSGRFVLLDQPSGRQRRCEEDEDRFMAPNPIVVCLRELHAAENAARILGGSVTVKLVGKDGEELPGPNESKLESLGGYTHQLDKNCTASFSLKLRQRLSGYCCLQFLISYATEGSATSIAETLTSRPFVIYSDRKRNFLGEKPVPETIMPTSGPNTSETELWIKGSKFSKSVSVLVDGQSVPVLDMKSNFISCTLPKRLDLTITTPVEIVVKNNDTQLEAEHRLQFTYRVRKSTTSSSTSTSSANVNI